MHDDATQTRTQGHKMLSGARNDMKKQCLNFLLLSYEEQCLNKRNEKRGGEGS